MRWNRYTAFSTILDPLFARIDVGELVALTREFTLAEALDKPFADGNVTLQQRYVETLQNREPVRIVPTSEILIVAARLRAQIATLNRNQRPIKMVVFAKRKSVATVGSKHHCVAQSAWLSHDSPTVWCRSANACCCTTKDWSMKNPQSANADGVGVNQFMATPATGKLPAMNTAMLFAEHRERADFVEFGRLMLRKDREPPQLDDLIN